jgi:aspartyl-tRNA(Asn)/glutamyl-tRNA(Gln) amidotransferase subunit C
MAQITRDDVLKLARLSRLRLQEDEVDKFVKELDEIVRYVQQIKAVDVKNTQPTDQVTGLVNVMRSDETVDYGSSPKDLLKNAPAVEKDQIKVKRVLQ